MDKKLSFEVQEGQKIDDEILDNVVGGISLPAGLQNAGQIQLCMISPVKKPIAHK